MIKEIEELKNFGVYKDFKWSGIKEFSYKNLIYGWNYSGKTTLSRFFEILRNKEISRQFQNASFKLKTDDGIYTNSNIDQLPYNLLVFNSDYIEENLTFSKQENQSSESSTILFQTGDNAKLEKKIETFKQKIEEIVGNSDKNIPGKIQKFNQVINDFEDYDRPNTGEFTRFSKEIKDEHFLSLINFTKSNLKTHVNEIKADIKHHLIMDKKELKRLSEIVKISEPKVEINNISIESNYNVLFLNLIDFLRHAPDENIVNDLVDNKHYDWVKEGLSFNNVDAPCEFCGNIVSKKRIAALNQFYNSQASLVKEKAKELLKSIETEEQIIKNSELPRSSNDFNLGYQEIFQFQKKKIDTLIEKYLKHLNAIKKQVKIKVEKNLYVAQEPPGQFKLDLLFAALSELNNTINLNNDFSSNYNSRIKVERDKFIKHLVASFVIKEKFFSKEKTYNKAIGEHEKLTKAVGDYSKEIELLEGKKFSDSEGAIRYTSFIQNLLGRPDLEVQIDSDSKKFKLLRNGVNASHLSDGEKTAIAFSHFLVSIHSLEQQGKFTEFIVFIDDPISSLDGNHIFQINSLLKEVFFTNDNPNSEWTLKCKQLFISTHNFEFFNLLRELPMDKPLKESKYYIERFLNKNESQLKELPKTFEKFKTEYHFLFNEIYAFSRLRKPLESDKLLLMPNTLRRFLEMYTLTKYPSAENVDRRADKIFTPLISKRICKPFHYFSHLDKIDRIGKQSEFIADIPVACKELIKHIKTKDKPHFEALTLPL